MRAIISILVAFVLFASVGYLVYSGNVVLSEFYTGLAVALFATALGILCWGFRPRIDRFLKESRNVKEGKKETAVGTKGEAQVPVRLLDRTQITKLGMDDSLLDELYEQARHEAIHLYEDARFSSFTIQVFPYEVPSKVNIYLYFYSKWADKVCGFVSYNCVRQVEHLLPDKRPWIASERGELAVLPWKESPQWMRFVERAYAKI